MSLILNVPNGEIRDFIREKFDFLVDLFEFNPNDVYPNRIEVSVTLSLRDFLECYFKEYGFYPENYVVGFAAKNGRIFILNKDLFEERGHLREEFESVVLHELCHIFIRRMLYPKHTFRWIEEGFCEYISFKDHNFVVSKFVPFSNIESVEGWRKFSAYQQSAKFFEYLDIRFGIKKIIRFLKSIKVSEEYEAFERVFGLNFEDVEADFFKSLGLKDGT